MSSQKTIFVNIERQHIEARALDRIAQIFGVNRADLRLDHVFGTDLQPSFVSDFKRNEFDKIHSDILDVADKTTLKKIRSGHLVIKTVGDYCDHMANCYDSNQKEVCLLLEIAK